MFFSRSRSCLNFQIRPDRNDSTGDKDPLCSDPEPGITVVCSRFGYRERNLPWTSKQNPKLHWLKWVRHSQALIHTPIEFSVYPTSAILNGRSTESSKLVRYCFSFRAGFLYAIFYRRCAKPLENNGKLAIVVNVRPRLLTGNLIKTGRCVTGYRYITLPIKILWIRR